MAKQDVTVDDADATDFRVDELRLDVEWRRQAELCRKYGRKLARKRLRVDEAETALDVCEAELALKIRSDPGKFDIPGRVTNDAIKETVRIQPEYQAARQAVNQAKYDAEIYRSAVNSMEHKKAALENLVKLHGREYYADPHLPTEATPEVIRDIKDRSRAEGARRKHRERDD